MGWDVAIDGRLKFTDRAALERFQAAKLASAPELAEAAAPFARAAEGRTVREALARCAGDGFTVTAQAESLSFRGLWAKDTFFDLGATLALLVATAARLGGRGALVLVGLGPELAYRLTADKERARVVTLSAADHAKLSVAPWVADAIESAAAAPSLPAPSEAGLGSVERALEILARLDDDALFACAGDLPPGVSVRQKGKPLDEAWVLPTVAYPSGAALRAALFPRKKPQARPEWQPRFALPALAAHDPAAAEPLAIAVLGAGAEQDLRASAVHALGRCPTQAAVDALFAALGTRAQADFALSRNPHPSIGPRALAELDARSIDELLAADAYGAYLSTRGAELVRVLGNKQHEPALDALLAIWDRRGKSPAASLVGFALIGVGHPRGLAAAAAALDDAEPAMARMGARAFVKLDRATAFERAAGFFSSTEPGPARRARAVLEVLAWDLDPAPGGGDPATPPDPRWFALAATLAGPPFVKAAAEGLLAAGRKRGQV